MQKIMPEEPKKCAKLCKKKFFFGSFVGVILDHFVSIRGPLRVTQGSCFGKLTTKLS